MCGAGILMRAVFKQIFTNNLFAKVASLLLATLLWAVIKKSQVSENQMSQQKPVVPTVEFGAGVYGK